MKNQESLKSLPLNPMTPQLSFAKAFRAAVLRTGFATVFSIAVLLSSAGCTHLASVSTTSIPPAAERKTRVHAEAYKFMFLLFNFSNDYVNTVVADLGRQCPNGKVQGLLTKQEGITYFPIIAHAVRVTADGYCVAKN